MASELLLQVSLGLLGLKAKLFERPAKVRILSPALHFAWPSLLHRVDLLPGQSGAWLSSSVQKNSAPNSDRFWKELSEKPGVGLGSAKGVSGSSLV